MSIDFGLLLIRVVVGLVLAAHGAQKLFGWFGGYGLRPMASFMATTGLKPGLFWASLAGLSEFGGGVLLALGWFNPLGALGMIAAMTTAITLMHWGRFFASNNGMEFPLVLGLAALGLAVAGPGRYSLDQAMGIALPIAPILAIGLVGIGISVAISKSMAIAARVVSRNPTSESGEMLDKRRASTNEKR
ncbi:MAG: putative rane protein [Chloroflexi bacterium]|nr:putative rane protein [Chloroflexota bacterium]